jgi:hypothetical protein
MMRKRLAAAMFAGLSLAPCAAQAAAPTGAGTLLSILPILFLAGAVWLVVRFIRKRKTGVAKTARWAERIAPAGAASHAETRRFFMDYKRNVKYFTKPSYKIPIGLIVVGIVLCVVGVWVVAIPLIGIGVLLIVFAGKGRPADAEMDALVAPPENLVEMALGKHGVNLEDAQRFQPFIWGGYYNPAEAAIMGVDPGVVSREEYAKDAGQALEIMGKQMEVEEGSSVFNKIKDINRTTESVSAEMSAKYGGKAILSTIKGKDGVTRSNLLWWGIWLFSNTTLYTFTLARSLTQEWERVSAEEYPYQGISKVTIDDAGGYKAARLQMLDGTAETCIVRDEAMLSTVNALRQEIRDRRV